MTRVSFHELAERELNDAALYYDSTVIVAGRMTRCLQSRIFPDNTDFTFTVSIATNRCIFMLNRIRAIIHGVSIAVNADARVKEASVTDELIRFASSMEG